jgi:hypothetical protein
MEPGNAVTKLSCPPGHVVFHQIKYGTFRNIRIQVDSACEDLHGYAYSAWKSLTPACHMPKRGFSGFSFAHDPPSY